MECLEDPSIPSATTKLQHQLSALGERDAVEQCKEIQKSEVNKCPIDDLRLVLEEGTSVPLRSHQRLAVKKFRRNVDEGAEGESRAPLVRKTMLECVFLAAAFCFVW